MCSMAAGSMKALGCLFGPKGSHSHVDKALGHKLWLLCAMVTVKLAKLPAGKFNKHVDTWDSNKDNKFFSLEGFLFVQQQIWNFSKPSDLATPEFCILKKYKKYEIRR